ncbi:replication terminator protein [Oceanobacillus profundus]|uniref:replication terminator protein n=1 Tax=Oceanobacillus profundus TaxID=372463 RepID=UPI0020404D9E|nr:replication terminator protein [Oceanobacillus profundus]MCM3396463.1 replication terminator protein [Oceanobacillus profundus]
MEYMVDLNEFADGALAARFNEELQKVLDNIADPNTDPKKARTVTIQVKFYGDDRRDVINASVVAKSKLLPAKEADTKLLMGADTNGNIIGKELRSGVQGQMFVDDDGDVAIDTGEKVNEVVKGEGPDKVISFRNQSTN